MPPGHGFAERHERLRIGDQMCLRDHLHCGLERAECAESHGPFDGPLAHATM
jgi:hypothetical protein